MEKGCLNLGSLLFRVLDEADEMLRMGFVDDVELILGMLVLLCTSSYKRLCNFHELPLVHSHQRVNGRYRLLSVKECISLLCLTHMKTRFKSLCILLR